MINLLDPVRVKKERVALIGFLRGAKMDAALSVLYFAEKYHNGTRKDGFTPEFAHQIQICLFLTTLNLDRSILESCIIAALAHDLFEDNQELTCEYVANECAFSIQTPKSQGHKKDFVFSESMAKGLEAAMVLSKIRNGVKMSQDTYLQNVARNVIAALVKGVDRGNNFQTMSGVFSKEKQIDYIDEGIEILAYLKVARKRFPAMSNAFFNIEHMLKAQIELISIMLDIHPTRKSL